MTMLVQLDRRIHRTKRPRIVTELAARESGSTGSICAGAAGAGDDSD